MAGHHELFWVLSCRIGYPIERLKIRWGNTVRTRQLTLTRRRRFNIFNASSWLGRIRKERRHGMDNLQVVDQVLGDGILHCADELIARLVVSIDSEVGVKHLVRLADRK